MLSHDRGDRLIRKAGGFGRRDWILSDQEVVADKAVVIDRGDRQAVCIAARLAVRLHADAVAVKIADRIGVLGPIAGVAGRNRHNGGSVLQIVEDLLISFRSRLARAGTGRAEREVDRIRTEHDCILNGCRIVRVIRAALVAEDLHDQNLCIRRCAVHMYAVQCRDISAVSVRQIPVGRRDTGNMGAVLALRVRLMRYVQILVDVAIAVCDLFCPVQIRRTDAFLDMLSLISSASSRSREAL